MTTLSHNLELTEKQVIFLLDYGINAQEPHAIHIIEGKTIHQSFNDINAYFSGQYVFFFEGDSTRHSLFLKTVLKTSHIPKLEALHTGISLYQNWLASYIRSDNEVIVSSTITPGEVTYTM